MPLDVRGDIAAGQLALWVPIAILAGVLLFRYGMRRDAGYLFLVLFSLIRIAEGALIIAGELQPNDPNVFTAAYVMFEAGLPILFLSALGFLGLAGQHSYSEYPRTINIFRFFGLVPVVGLAIHIAGGALSAVPGPSSNDPTGSNANTALILRRVAAGIDAFNWLTIIGLTFMAWGFQRDMRGYRRQTLLGITIAILPLGVRAAYSILEAWSSADLYGARPSSNPTFAQFQPIVGDWVMYLVLGLVMEYLTAALFLVATLVLGRRSRRYY